MSSSEPTVYTEKDLLANIQKETTESFIVFPKHITETDPYNGDKYLLINLKNYNLRSKFLKSIKISTKSCQRDGVDIISKEFIEKIFIDSFYDILVGKVPVYQSHLTYDECLPFFLLNGFLNYHDTELKIDGISHADVLDYLILEITVTHVEFPEEFIELIYQDGTMIQQTVTGRDNKMNLFRTLSDMGGNVFKKYVSLEKLNEFLSGNQQIVSEEVSPQTKEQVFAIHDIHGSDLTMGNLKAFKFNSGKDFSSKCLYPIIIETPYDISISADLKIYPTLDNYYVSKNENSFTHNFSYSVNRRSDLISSLQFIFKSEFKPSKLTVRMSLKSDDTEFARNLLLSQISPTCYSEEAGSFYNTLLAKNGFSILFSYDSDLSLNPFEGLAISYSEMYLRAELRQYVFNSNVPEISVEKLNQILQVEQLVNEDLE